MRILVTGARGQLGRALLSVLPAAGHEVVGVDLPDGDLADPGVAAGMLLHLRPCQVIHTAGYTAVDRAEVDHDGAERANVTATAELAAACEVAGCPLTFVSTDYVFAGDQPSGYAENAARAPVNWYGQTKARAEVRVLEMSVPSRVVRTSWLFGHGPNNFVRTIRNLLRERDVLRVVDDQHGSPTYAADLADQLADLLPCDAWGVFHATNSGVTTWCGLAREVARLEGHDPARVEACTTADYPTPARRPACSILLDARLRALGLPRPPTWQDAVQRYLTWLGRNEETPAS
ncbi:MAG: dTDP-4-dehydrorhamnose reductase [Candidatus Krumholzibacteriia bacterium]